MLKTIIKLYGKNNIVMTTFCAYQRCYYSILFMFVKNHCVIVLQYRIQYDIVTTCISYIILSLLYHVAVCILTLFD